MNIMVKKSVPGKYGPQLLGTDGKYYSFSKFYKGELAFPEGTTLDVDLYTSPKGNSYINSASILSNNPEPVSAPKVTDVKPVRKAKFTAKVAPVVEYKEPPKERDYDKENYGKVKSLFLQSIMPQLINGVMTDDELKAVIRKWANYCFEDDRQEGK